MDPFEPRIHSNVAEKPIELNRRLVNPTNVPLTANGAEFWVCTLAGST
jgi:hypothetical protein